MPSNFEPIPPPGRPHPLSSFYENRRTCPQVFLAAMRTGIYSCSRHHAEIEEYSSPPAKDEDELIPADTSIWIDHFRSGNRRSRNNEMRKLLNEGQIVIHPAIIAELALGSLQDRSIVGNRHKIAHGDSVSLSIGSLTVYHKDAVAVVELLQKTCV